jgi:hypothetical protein
MSDVCGNRGVFSLRRVEQQELISCFLLSLRRPLLTLQFTIGAPQMQATSFINRGLLYGQRTALLDL